MQEASQPRRALVRGIGGALAVVGAILAGPGRSQETPAEPPPVALEVARPVARIGTSSAVTVLKLSSDGRRLGIGKANGEVEIWDPVSQKTAERRTIDGRVVVALSPDLETVATMLPRKYSIEVWERESGKLRHTLRKKGALLVLAGEFSPDGKTLAVAVGQFYFGGVHLWDLGTGRLRRELDEIAEDIGMTCGVTSVAFSPDGNTVFANDTISTDRHLDGVVGVWDTHTGKWQASMKGGANLESWFSVAVSPDQTQLAMIDRRKVKLWNLRTGTLIRELELSTEVRESHVIPYSGYWPDRELCAEFSRDGELLATSNGTVEVWDVATGEKTLTLPENVGATQLAFLPDGKSLACGYLNGTVRIWEVRQ